LRWSSLARNIILTTRCCQTRAGFESYDSDVLSCAKRGDAGARSSAADLIAARMQSGVGTSRALEEEDGMRLGVAIAPHNAVIGSLQTPLRLALWNGRQTRLPQLEKEL
jgi:hypothetical protein